MHLCEIEALAVGQDGSGPSPVAEGQRPGAASNSQSRPEADKAARGRRNERNATDPSAVRLEPTSEFTSRAKAAWGRLIRKVCEVDPLECPKSKGPMRIITLIDDPRVIRRILEHLGLRQAGRPADRAAQQARAGCKPENGEGSRNRDSESLLLRADEVIR
jgi:hypothetical protein